MLFSSWLRNRTSNRAPLGRAQHRSAGPRFQPRLEALEDRWMPSALTVTTAADSGAGTLRAEIAAANSGDTINFASSLQGQTITLTSGELLINKGLTIQGPGAAQLTISGGNASQVFDVTSSQPVVLAGLTMSNGHNIQGGGISNAAGSNLTVSGCTISNCQATGFGGGIANWGTLTLSGCTISGDSAISGNGGGIANANVGTLTATNCTLSRDVAGGLSCGGGGIYNTGNLTAIGCTLSGDSGTFGVGGGIYVRAGQASLTNCTIAGNFANGTNKSFPYSGTGGGLYLGIGSAKLTNCTVSLNRANGLGGGIDVVQGGNLYLTNTIVAGNTDNTGAGYSELSGGADIYGFVETADHNLVGNGLGCRNPNVLIGNIVGSPSHVINAMLGPLQNNGGPTMTMALFAGSPAIGQANSAFAPSTDQRGVIRFDLVAEMTDIGAFEF
jgi:hypothetical protein